MATKHTFVPMRSLPVFLLVLLASSVCFGQYRPTPASSELLHDLQKLQCVGSALYVAAHPDDENTRLIAWLANEEKVETAYLSLTRGDGGQNLVGTDIREGLGVIRTQELIAARNVDGGRQFFSRANDFGFSKHPDETFNFWNKDSILCDMVWTIRKWQPDVIVTRFDPESAGRTHGHHTASAMLAVEAYELAADPQAFPEQLAFPGIKPWRATRILFNTSWWFYGSRERFAKADKSDLVEVDAGAYYPLLGYSNGEIAAKSRSQHASQGFGSSATRGSQKEYLKFLAGEFPEDRTQLFGGIDVSWSRMLGGEQVKTVLAKAEAAFDPAQPAAIVPQLIEALKLIKQLPANRYTVSKTEALEQLIADCLGIYFEVTAPDSVMRYGAEIRLDYELIRRESGAEVLAEQIEISGQPVEEINKDLSANEGVNGVFTITWEGEPSEPYWLSNKDKTSLGMYYAPAYGLRGEAENPPSLSATATLFVDGERLTLSAPVLYKRTYPDKGQIYRKVLQLPPFSARFTEPVYLWGDASPKAVEVVVEALAEAGTVNFKLDVPAGWTSTPAEASVDLAAVGSKQTVAFSVTPGETASGTLDIVGVGESGTYDLPGIKVLRYEHIPQQVLPEGGEAKAVKLDLKKHKSRIGYLMGAGDLVPEALKEIGYQVELLSEQDVQAGDLSVYETIVVGIRAYNAVDWLPRVNAKLMAYVEAGGTMVVQYNTSRRLDMAEYAPYPIELSRKRVTVEEAPIRFLQPESSVLNFPNKLTQTDFDNWVQERGLYFPEKWDKAYTAILSSNDPGEEPLDGSLLIADYGKGKYIYTGLSFFRELPAGVPGAYRLFVNLIEQ